jgi:ribosomal protein S18 acetylase RimI-like enzyme
MPIRKADARDEAAIAELAREFNRFGDYVGAFLRMLHGEEVGYGVRFPVEIYVQEGDDGGILGFIAVEWEDGSGRPLTGNLHGIAVRPRARRGGIASSLLDHVVALAGERGVRRLTARTAEVDNPAARSFFESRKFALQGHAGRYRPNQPAIYLDRTLGVP